jgi:carbamoyl-phosphate synthase small subunit
MIKSRSLFYILFKGFSHMSMMSGSSAILVLDDGSDEGIVFYGKSIGVNGSSVGEVVFNTSMTGYQEILSDPSYAQQIITLTYPHIGNTGTNNVDNEADNVYTNGLIIRENSLEVSNCRAQNSLTEYLIANNVVAISNIDTRKLTKILREKGSLSGCITTDLDENKALRQAQEFGGLKGLDLAQEVSTLNSYEFNEGSFDLTTNSHTTLKNNKYKVVVYDYGVKKNILRMLVDRDCELTIVSAKTPASEVLAMKPDGVFLSNGPGDPEPCDYAINNIQTLLNNNVPMFGICLGHQLLGLALGCTTEKMKFGHHGANHPVQDLTTKEVLITSQNHGFALSNLSDKVELSHASLFDGSVQGIKAKNNKAFGFQGHPEASPGPQDGSYLFDDFIKSML